MLSRTAKSGNKYGVKRGLSIMLSSVLAFTLLQVAPPANAAAPLFVDLVTRADDVVGGQSVLLGETQLLQTSPTAIYRLDIVPECGLLDHIGDIPVTGVTTIMETPVNWTAQPKDVVLFGTPEKLEQVLDNLRIIRETGDFGYVDCPLSRVSAWLVEESQWLGDYDPQGTASYVINDSSYPLPTLTTFDSEYNFLTTSRLNTFSNGFEVEWDQFEGSLGYTPAGYSLRYREVFDGQEQRGPWIYQKSADGRQKSLVVQDPVPAFLYEVEIAPSVVDCDSNTLYGKYESVPFHSQFGLSSDPSLLTPNNPQMIEGEVVSQCLSPCVPTETVAFDGEKLGTILEFTSTDACTWTVPSNFTSGTLSAYVVGGGGGGGAAGGGGGGGGGFNTSIDLPIAIDDTWTVRVGTGGVGSDLSTIRGDSGTSSSVTYPGSNGDETITALGGGGGGSKDQSGENSGGDGTYTGETLKLTFGGAGSGSQGTEGLERTLFDNKYYGDGGSGGDGSVSGSSFIDGIFASGGGGGAVCSAIDELNYPGGTSQNGGSGGYCGGNSQPGSRDGNDASANTGGGGGGGASDADGHDGAGGDGASGVIYIVHTEAPIARYLPSSCILDLNGYCASWENTTSLDPNFTATITGAPVVTTTSNPALNGSVLQDSIPVVQGGPGGPNAAFDSISFPVLITPDSGYTLFTVARYNEKDGGQYRRIFDSGMSDADLDGNLTLRNWLSGFWGGKSGIAYHGDSPTSSYEDRNWLTPDETSVHNKDWVLSTDQLNLYRSNGTKRSVDTYSGGVGPGQLVVNQGSRDERSDYQIADVISFDRELSETEYKAVEAYLGDRYGICVSNCSPPEITTASTLDPGDVGTPYTTTIQVNGASEVFFALSPGSLLPEGLSIDEQTGVISGIPTLDADFTFTIVVTNLSNGQSSSQEFTMTVNAIPPPPEPPVFETDSTLQGGKVNQYYTQTIVATSPQPLVFLVVDPSNFPQGLELDSNEGIISGTPEIVGNYSFTIEVNDTVNNQSAFRVFTIAITEALQITSAESAKILFDDTYPPVSVLVSELLGPGISATDVKVNGESEFNSQNAPSFGTFTRGADSVGIEDGIVLSPRNVESFQRDKELDPGQLGPFGNITLGNIFDAIENLLRRAKTWKFASDDLDDGPPPVSVDGFYEVCNTALDEECANNTTSLEFELSPTAGQRFLKFEYAIAGTEPTEVEAYNFPDGFALFVGGLEETDNCALIPDGMMDAATSETIGLPERYLSVGNLRLVGFSRTVDSDSSLNAVDVSSVLSCVVDTAGYPANEPVRVAMVIANANDQLFAPAVFLKAGSVRFESFGISTDALPNGTVDENYLGHTFETTGGVGPFTFALAQGAELPAGLDLSPSGSITGIPTAAGTFTFGIVATDGASNASTQNFTLVIDPEPEKPGVRKLIANTDGYERRISWDQPLDAPDGMTYDVTAGPDENSLIELSNGNESPNSTGITTTSYSQFAEALAAREGDDFVVRVVAHWPTGETSTVTKTFTNYRDVCPLVSSCGTTGSDTPSILPHWKKVKSEIEDAKTAQGNGDAFDGGLQVKIGSTYAEAESLQCDTSTATQNSDEVVGILGHSIVCSSEEVAGLSVQLSRFFFESSMWTRTFVSVQNNSNTDFTGHIWLKSNMGSDEDTRYEATSNGTVGGFSADDIWAVTGDTGGGDPVAIHMFGQGLQDSSATLIGRNEDGSDYVIPQYALDIAAGDSVNRAWFTGLVGYTNGGYIDALGNAISAAESFPAYSNDWNAEQPLFNPPTLVAGAGIPITRCDNTDTTQFVAMFSSDATDEYGDPLTDFVVGGEDSNLLNSLCQSFDVRIFDGGDGSVDHWSENLDGAQALVFPEMYSEFNLLDVTVEGAPLITADVLEELQSWNNPSHPIIFTGAGSHIKDIGALLSVDLQEIQTTRDQGPFERSEGVSFAAPEQLTYINDVASLDFRNTDVSTLIGLSFEISYQTLYQSGNSDLIVPAATFTNNHHGGGRVYYLGYDWQENAQADGSTNWSNLLEMAVSDTLFASDGNLPEDDRFLQGDFVEVGIGGNGHFGSTGAAPEGYHPRDAGGGEGPGGGSSANRLGFVSDRDRDGWGVGQDDGDFFVPGTPFEGFGVDVGGTSYFNNHEDTDIARLSEVTDVTPERQQSTWTSQVMSNGLQVTQVAAVPVNDQRLDVTVTLTNTSDIALEDVYYARQVDNDANVYACRENDGGWSSLNTVEAQASTNDGLSLVSSTMMDDCNDDEATTDLSAPHSYLGMVSTDPNSVAALQYDEEYGFDGFGSQKAVDFVTGVLKNECVKRGNESCLRVNITPGAQVFGDSGIGLGFDLGTIEPGSTKTVTFSYILSPEQAQEIIDQHNNENEIVSPVLTASKNSFVAVVDSAFNLLAADWIDSQAGGAVSYFTVSPELPSGLSLNSTTGQISGTPTELLSTSSFTLTAHNLAGSSSVEFLLAVTDGPYLFNESGALMASWPSPSSNVVPEYEYSYSGDGGASWTESVTIENTTSPVMSVNLSATVGAEYIFRVRAVGDEVWFESEPFYFGLTGCSSINSQLRVLMLSAQSTQAAQGTNPATSDSNIWMAACSSSLVSVEIFDGQGYGAGAVKGSADAWRTALEDIDVVVLPRLSSGDLEDSDLMSEAAFQELKYWVESGGRLILTGAASYVNDLNRLTYTDNPEYRPIESAPVESASGVRRVGGANTSLPATLPTFENDGLDVSQASPDFIASNYGETSDWLSPSLVTSFLKGKGWVVALSNEFTTADANWTKVLRQSIQSSVNPGIVVSEGGAYWYMNNGELHSQLDFQYLSAPGGIVRIGSETSSTSISCINTPSNPAIIYRNTEGTTVKCGKVNIDDGLVDRPVEVRLTRFFAASSPWVKTSVSIENVDRDNEYRNSVWFGGELGLGDKPLLEVDGQKQTSQNEHDYESPITVASAGDYVRTDYDSGDGHMVIRINSNFPSEVFGGLRLDENSDFTRDQMWTKSLFMLEPEESATFSWFESFAIYEPGCDRMASLNAWNKTEAFYSRALQENSNDGFKLNSRLTFPDLSDIGCQVYDARLDVIQMTDLGGSVRLNWDRIDSADKYEIMYRIEGADTWDYLDEISADESDLVTYLAQGLSVGQTYKFMVRPIQENRNMAGDTAQGAWKASGSLTISTPPTPSNSPSPSSSASPSPSQSQSPPPPSNDSVVAAPAPAQVIPQMIAQTGPGFPARLKKGKTVKFGMTAPSGLPLRVSSVGKCKTTAITKSITVKVLVGKKIKKKKVKVQTGWAVKGSKKGVCTVTFSNSGDATRSPLAAAGTITIF